jgi:uncharacterized protein YaiE (UPF0345 family)
MIKVNEYLEGKVKSLGFELDGTQYTVGVMLPGHRGNEREGSVGTGEAKIL